MAREGSGGGQNPFALEMIAQRAKHGLTQGQLAAQMFVSTSTVSNIETGYRAPSAEQISHLAAIARL